jgi:hypothetical protein
MIPYGDALVLNLPFFFYRISSGGFSVFYLKVLL